MRTAIPQSELLSAKCHVRLAGNFVNTVGRSVGLPTKKLALVFLLSLTGVAGANYGESNSTIARDREDSAVSQDVGWAALPSAKRASFDAVLKKYERTSEPGCAVGVYRNGDVFYAGGFGLSDLATKQKINATTSINMGSIGKQFTAAAIVLLAQDGKLSLDDDVRKYIPELRDYAQRVTIRQLLTHTSGVRDYRGLLNLAGHRNDEVIRRSRILEILALQRGLSFKPGEQVLYSNSGYFLAGLIVERLSGLPFHTFMRKRIFEPLGMTNTRFKGDTEGLSSLAKHHAPSGEGQFESNYEPWEDYGTGDLYSSIEDLALWDGNFRSGKVGGRSLIEALETPAGLTDGRTAGYGLGLLHSAMHGHRAIGHTGGSEGSVSNYQRFPDANVSVVTLCNRTDGPADALTAEVAALVLPPKSERAPYLAPYADKPNAPIENWIGSYHAVGNSTVLTVNTAAEGLAVELGGGKFPLKPVGGDVYQVIGGPPDTYARFVAASGTQPRQLIPLNSEDPPMLAFVRSNPRAEDLLPLTGEYRCPEFAAKISFHVDKGKLVANIPPEPGEMMQPLGPNQFTFERLVFTFDQPLAGGSPGVRVDQWRARGMRCERVTDTPRAAN